MRLLATAPGGARLDITPFYRALTWSGSCRACGRELQMELFNPRRELVGAKRPEVPVGTVVELEEDGGGTLFYGMAVTVSQDNESSVLSVNCLDNGRFLARSEGWWDFRSITAEDAARQICRELGVEAGELAATGVKLTRKFHGVAAYRAIATLYTLAGEQTQRRYAIGFEGRALTVRAKSEGVPELVIAPGANLMRQSTKVDVSKLYNQVDIYTQEGKLIRTVDDPESRAAYGSFRKLLTQTKGEDAGKEAQAALEDNGLAQTVTVECLGDTALVTGQTVALVDALSGTTGRFWVDSDTHSWRKGVYTTKVELNFRNIMDSQTAGSEK